MTTPTATGFTTADTPLDDGTTAKFSECTGTPPTTLANTKYIYTYNLYRDTTVSKTTDNNLHEQIHKYIAAEFLDCNDVPGGLWQYMSPPHELKPDDVCTTTSSGSDFSNTALSCEVWTATETIGVVTSEERRLQRTQNEVALAINEAIQQAMEENLWAPIDGDGNPSQLVYAGGPTFIYDDNPTPSPVSASTKPTSEVNQAAANDDGGGISDNMTIVAVLAVFIVSAFLLFLVSRRHRGKASNPELDELAEYDNEELLDRASPRAETFEESKGIMEEQHPDAIATMPPSPTGIKSRSFPLAVTTTPEKKYELKDPGQADFGDNEENPTSPRLRKDENSDVYTSSSPGKRSDRSPLSAMDELDRPHGSTAYDIAAFIQGSGNAKAQDSGEAQDSGRLNSSKDTIHL